MITICYKITLPKKSGFALGECEIEVNRMRQIADNFPGAVLAFCTLRSTLTNREKKAIAKLARRGRKHFKAEQWINPVLVLAGIELFDHFEPPSCWKDKGKPYSHFADNHHIYNNIQELCNVTQQMHLGIESYWDWYEQRRQKRLKKLKKKNPDKKI